MTNGQARNNSITLFVPGIMGSTLRFRGQGQYGEPVDEEIWGADLWSNADLLATNPALLSLADVEPGEVLRELRTGWVVRFGVYRELLDYCSSATGLSLAANELFYPFPYDWRADNRESATKLAEFIRAADPAETMSVRIIAHSMGGIVARLMLLADEPIANRTTLFFQIASPIEGSAKAFYTLKKRPKFDRIFDSLWKFFHHLDPDRCAQLQQTLQGFPSLYQLLPPSSVKTIFDRAGKQYSAVDSQVWPNHLAGFVRSAAEVHQLLQNPLRGSIQCVYSNSHLTDIFYQVDNLFNIVGSQNVDGDGTVCCSSAFAQTSLGTRHLISGRRSDHNGLCRNRQVLQLLKEAFA